MSIRDQVRSDTSEEGWAIHTNGSLRYMGCGSPIGKYERGDP